MCVCTGKNIVRSHIFYNRRIILYAIKFFHKSLLNAEPCSHFFVTNMLEAAKRVTAHKINSASFAKWLSIRLQTKLLWVRVPLHSLKKALSLDNLNKIFVKLNQNKTNLADQRLLTTILIAFCGFMRFSEVLRLDPSDFISSSTYVKVFIEKSRKECGFTSQLLVKFVH